MNITQRSRRFAASTALLVAVGGAAFIAPGAANAAPVSASAPVPGTQCNVGQVERATAKVAPEFWAHISKNPKTKERFEQMLVLTPEQRKAAREAAKKAHEAKIEAWKKAHPGQTPPARGHHGDGPGKGGPKLKKEQMEKIIAQVKATCSTS